MSWNFPLKIPHAGETISYQDFNDGLGFVAEMDGRLGEGNWNSGNLRNNLGRKTDLAEDISMRVYHEAHNIDIADTSESTSPSAVDIYGTGDWTVLCTASVYTRSGSLFVTASTQLLRNTPTTVLNQRDFLHVQLGLRVNGALYPVTVVGDLDDLESGDNMELGLQGATNAAVVEGVFPVASGPNTVEFVARALPARITVSTQQHKKVQATSREMLVVEVW
jgi:hypothetical protein